MNGIGSSDDCAISLPKQTTVQFEYEMVMMTMQELRDSENTSNKNE